MNNFIWTVPVAGTQRRLKVLKKLLHIIILTHSYGGLSDLVEHMFPSFALDTDYGAFNYWREATNTQQNVCDNEAELFLEKYRKKPRGNFEKVLK